MASQADVQKVEVYTTNEPTQAKAVQYKGLVIASKVKSRNMFSDIGSGKFTTHLQLGRIKNTKSEDWFREVVSLIQCLGFKSLVGGEVKGLSKLTMDIREELLWELREKAVNLGANAIVGLRYVTLQGGLCCTVAVQDGDELGLRGSAGHGRGGHRCLL